jgi:hypothetical protein
MTVYRLEYEVCLPYGIPQTLTNIYLTREEANRVRENLLQLQGIPPPYFLGSTPDGHQDRWSLDWVAIWHRLPETTLTRCGEVRELTLLQQ